MALLNYKFFHLHSYHENLIEAQLNKIYLGKHPIVLDIRILEDHEEEVLEILEVLLRDKLKCDLPYPVYILSNIVDYHGLLDVFRTEKELPQFFNFKTKQLSHKEEILQERINLKILNLNTLSAHDYTKTLKKYSDNHRKIYDLHHELEFWEDIDNQLGVKNE